jgi:hypothetical protein
MFTFRGNRLEVVCKTNPFLPTPTSNVKIGHNVTFFEISKQIVGGRFGVISRATSEILIAFSTMNLNNPDPIDVPRF